MLTKDTVAMTFVAGSLKAHFQGLLRTPNKQATLEICKQCMLIS
jgi:hypothetical protein